MNVSMYDFKGDKGFYGGKGGVPGGRPQKGLKPFFKSNPVQQASKPTDETLPRMDLK